MSTVPPPPSYEQATGDPDAAYPPPHGIQGPAYPPPTDPYGMNTPYPPGETGPQTAFMPPHTATYETNPDPPPMTHASSDTAVESGGFESASSFSDKTVRRMFIRKVYLILMVQLLVTMGIIALFVFSSSVKFFVQQNSWLYWISYGLFIIFYIFLVCCEKIRRSYPTNIIMLALFTLCLSYMAGTISSYYDIRSVMIAFGISAGVCFGVTIFSMQTKFDFTTCGGLLFMCSLALFLFGIVSIFTYNHILQTVYAGLGALLFSAFLAFDTQLIMGGKRYELSPEEYIFASINLYIDVVYIFLFLLRLVGGGSGN